MSWDEGLIPEQKEVASYIGTHSRLIAGPGTGKTLSLTRRILYMIEEEGITPSNITVLTFTRAATSDLRKRIKIALEKYALKIFPQISTLHSFALRMILSNPSRTRLPQPIRIADDYEEREIIQEEIKRILNIQTIKEIQNLFNLMSADWERLDADNEGWEKRFPNPAFLGAWQDHRKIYGYSLRSELVYQLKLALQEEEFEFDMPIKHLLVDEYQDLNPCDLIVIKQLTNHGAELFCAGDDDQSIYGFRFANPEGIRRFQTEYPKSKPLELKTCMRCDKEILNMGLYVARQDPYRIDKQLVCKDDAKEGIVKILRFNGQREEAEGIARICEWLIQSNNIDPSEILLLLRSDKNKRFSKVIFESLFNRHIPAQIVSDPLAPLMTKDGRFFYSILHLLVNKKDHLAWRTILSLSNGIGPESLMMIYEYTRRMGMTYSEALFNIAREPSLIPRTGLTVKRRYDEINLILDKNKNRLNGDLKLFISDFAKEIIHDEQNRNGVLQLFEKIYDILDELELNKVLRAINISLQDGEQERSDGAISIMTMHQAKGLSGDAVFIVAAEDEYIPGYSTGQSIDDEKRLLYVSLTRARHYLFITHCTRRTREQQHSGRTSGDPRRTLTRFLSGGPIESISAGTYLTSLNKKLTRRT